MSPAASIPTPHKMRASIEPVMMVVQALGWSIRKAGGWLHRQGAELETWAHARRPKEPTT